MNTATDKIKQQIIIIYMNMIWLFIIIMDKKRNFNNKIIWEKTNKFFSCRPKNDFNVPIIASPVCNLSTTANPDPSG